MNQSNIIREPTQESKHSTRTREPRQESEHQNQRANTASEHRIRAQATLSFCTAHANQNQQGETIAISDKPKAIHAKRTQQRETVRNRRANTRIRELTQESESTRRIEPTQNQSTTQNKNRFTRHKIKSFLAE